MQVFLVGSGGMLGRDWKAELEARGHVVTAPGKKEFDITSRMQLDALLNRRISDFDWVLNAAAFTGVDEAESQLTRAMMVN